MAYSRVNEALPLAGGSDLALGGVVNDAANPFTDDSAYNGTTHRRRLRPPTVNGAGAAPDTALARGVCFARLNEAYKDGDALNVELTVLATRALGTHTKADVRVFALGADGVATGADLCTTAEQSFQGQTVATTLTFALNTAGLVAGSRLVIEVEINLNDTGAAGGSADAQAFLSRLRLTGTPRGGWRFVDQM